MKKEKLKQRENELIEQTAAFCKKYLDQEYVDLSENLIRKMGRKRAVPFERGHLNIWAAAVVYALSTMNFAFDPSFDPTITRDQIHDFFKTKQSTVSNKSKTIRDMFDMGYYDSEFSTSHMAKSNPMNDMVLVDGFIVPISSLPEEYQQMVHEARARGEDISFSSQ